MACRAWAGHRQKILPWRSRILGLVAFQKTWLHRTRFPASFLWWRMACRVWAGHRQKILPRRNRILGKWLFRRLAVGNTIKTLGFRHVLWESGPWKNFLKVLCPARNLRESGSFGKVSYYKVWPYYNHFAHLANNYGPVKSLHFREQYPGSPANQTKNGNWDDPKIKDSLLLRGKPFGRLGSLPGKSMIQLPPQFSDDSMDQVHLEEVIFWYVLSITNHFFFQKKVGLGSFF